MSFFGMLIIIIWILCALWVVYDVVATHHKMKRHAKITWIICAIFGIITAVIYYFTVKKK
jgi:uncharacterized membrane protein HdeD (DUF308 family)